MEGTAGYEERFSLGLEDVASYRDFFSAEEWDALVSGDWSGLPDDWKEDVKKTSLTEDDVLKMAAALDDYDHVMVTDIGGGSECGHWFQIRDRRFELSYPIESHCDYWDFIAALVDHTQCLSLTPLTEVA